MTACSTDLHHARRLHASNQSGWRGSDRARCDARADVVQQQWHGQQRCDLDRSGFGERQNDVGSELGGGASADIKSSGVIRVAMDETYPPFESVSSSGSVVGLDQDIANAIGQLLGVKVAFVNTPFDAIIPALAANKVDMAMSSIGDTKARQAIVDFATYYWNGSLLLVKKGNPVGLISDATCGASVGVIRGSLQQNTFLPAQAAKCKKAGKQAPTGRSLPNRPAGAARPAERPGGRCPGRRASRR